MTTNPHRPWYERPSYLAKFVTRLLRRDYGLPDYVRGRCWRRRTVYTFVLEHDDQVLLEAVISPGWVGDIYLKALPSLVGG
jgi:hypothetical protein